MGPPQSVAGLSTRWRADYVHGAGASLSAFRRRQRIEDFVARRRHDRSVLVLDGPNLSGVAVRLSGIREPAIASRATTALVSADCCSDLRGAGTRHIMVAVGLAMN